MAARLVAALLAAIVVGACGRIGAPVRSTPAPPPASASAQAEPECDPEEKSP